MNVAFQLFQVQEIDTSIDKCSKRISEIDGLITKDSRISKAEAYVNSSKITFSKKTNDFNALSDKIEKKKIKKSQSQSSLYSGKVQNPKELEDLQKEIASLDAATAKLDESLMEMLIDLDNSEKEFENAKAALQKAKSAFATEKSMLTAEKEMLQQKVDGLMNRRAPIFMQIPESDQSLYERLRKKKRGLAVASINDNSCSACGASLTAGERQTARSSNTLFICPTCSRIIYGSS